MHKKLGYRGFEINVTLHPVWTPSSAMPCPLKKGFSAMVVIRSMGFGSFDVATLRLPMIGQPPFPSEDEALVACSDVGRLRIDYALEQ